MLAPAHMAAGQSLVRLIKLPPEEAGQRLKAGIGQ